MTVGAGLGERSGENRGLPYGARRHQGDGHRPVDKDSFGLCRQVLPAVLARLLADPDPTAKQAMESMTKFDIAELQRAHSGR